MLAAVCTSKRYLMLAVVCTSNSYLMLAADILSMKQYAIIPLVMKTNALCRT